MKMILFSALVACFCAALLPSCASKDPLTWVSVEAQGAYLISDTGSGQKCGAIPNTFEMRADGTWLPSTEFDLTGNFEDDCGLHVSLSIPAQGGDPDPVSEWEDFLKQKRALRAKRKQLKADKKAYEAQKKKHRDEVADHETTKAREIEEENTKMAAKKQEVKDLQDRVSQLKIDVDRRDAGLVSDKKELEGRKNALKDGEDALEVAKREYENEKNKTDGDRKKIEGLEVEVKKKKELLKTAYENCKKPSINIEMIIPHSLRRAGYDMFLCVDKDI